MKKILRKTYNWIKDVLSMKLLTFLLLLNIIANGLSSIFYNEGFAFVSFVLLAAVIAFSEACIIKVASCVSWLRKMLICLFVGITNILVITDVFLIKEFNLIFGEDVINIIADTNSSEISNFSSAYFTISNILLIIGTVVGINILSYFMAKVINKIKYINMVNAILCIGGITLCCYTIYSQLVYGSGMGVPQYASITRYAHAGYLLNKRSVHIKNLQNICKDVVSTTSINDDRIIILVIGESFSKAHSSLYGYKLSTNPLLGELKERGELICFENVITPYNATHSTMQAIFSVGEFGSSLLFPCIFKNAGYYTHISENQYLIGASLNFLTDETLSELMFTDRADFKYVYDEELIDSIRIKPGSALYVLHLQGQHYAYENRYPKEFGKFEDDNYDEKKWNESQRKIIAHYDNATLYNDYVINKLIEKCRELNVCLIYFSDHGEEVYDVRDYMGHGDISDNKEAIELQVKIPFIVWTSDQFRSKNRGLVHKIKNNINTPITTNDLSHFLIGLGNIKGEFYNPKRDFLSEEYDVKRHRITLQIVDYDSL